MTELAEKLVPVVTAIETEKGSLELFALFMPEESVGLWDIVVAAPWAAANVAEAIHYVAGLVQSALSADELGQFSRVAIVRGHTAVLSSRFGEVRAGDAPKHAFGFSFGDADIRDAYFLALRRPPLRKRRDAVASR